jgi:hypothetical protein
MKIPFLVSSSNIGFWLAALTHPSWHLTERGSQVDLASPAGGKVKWDPTSDPYSKGSWEANDVVRCLIPNFDGAVLSSNWRDALWARFFTGAPRRQSGCVPRQAFRGRHGV